MISGYESDMYNEYLKGWKKEQFASCAEFGSRRTEVVWMNYYIGQMRIQDYIGNGIAADGPQDEKEDGCPIEYNNNL